MQAPRVDAAARREQLLDSADIIFSEHGVTAPLELVVRHSGLGRATLYRNFPDRSALIEGLLQRSLEHTAQRAAALEDRDDALFLLFEHSAAYIADHASMVDYWRTVEREGSLVHSARQRLTEIYAPALARAIRAGLCRADLSAADISLILGMLGACLRGKTGAQRQALGNRALELLIAGLKPAAQDQT